MPSLLNIFLFMIAGLALNITPGPDMLYVISRGISSGKKAGVISAAGIGTGTIVHILLTAFGVAALLFYSAVAFSIMKYAGAGYLIYLGVRAMLSKGVDTEEKENNTHTNRSLFWQGVVTNALNPKVAIFFMSFLPQFIDPSKGQVAFQIILLGVIFMVNGTFVLILVGLIAGSSRHLIKSNILFWKIQRFVTGSILVGLGLRLAFIERD